LQAFEPKNHRAARRLLSDFKSTRSIMQVSARPLTLNLLSQFNTNGTRNLKRTL
jgi:hypothetical protein